MPSLPLTLLPDHLAVCRLAPDAPLPAWAAGPGFVSITRTDEELSIVVCQGRVPGDVAAVGPWRALKVQGPLDFALTGILAALTAPLADAGISLFAIATYDTDYILVRAETLEAAITALTAAGHRVAA
ncbi:ACT domain-containing protein [Niveispirillum cyanobacteriorum]|uniref:ACT domain-containing protein n=1 Tax=Niveispirillum cyanobacteriorum TaxID=1612173 RepID=A0A2K9NEA9_9PROT|nr:ACT domain-containing protein [Niveispirillum cyanobacteriorum]AUN30866.1 ACT domain-containing protein [Niveispirillum cyanobacteriorum]GGE80305.1 amino acid-binding protein [Niveispirillum cyanobacteriorum]